MRNQKELRYLITPANYIWSLAAVAGLDARAAAGPKKADRPGRQARPAGRRPPGRRTAAAAGGAGGRRNRARRQLGPERLRPPDHARTGAAAGDQLCADHQLRHQHRDLAALHVRAGGPARLRRSHDPRQRVAAADAGARRCRRALARQPVRLQGRLRRSAERQRHRPQPARPVRRWPLPRRRPARRPGHAAAAGQGHAAAGAAPAGQPRAGVLPPLPAGLCALPAGLRQRRPAPVHAGSRSSTPTTTRCSTPTMCWPR